MRNKKGALLFIPAWKLIHLIHYIIQDSTKGSFVHSKNEKESKATLAGNFCLQFISFRKALPAHFFSNVQRPVSWESWSKPFSEHIVQVKQYICFFYQLASSSCPTFHWKSNWIKKKKGLLYFNTVRRFGYIYLVIHGRAACLALNKNLAISQPGNIRHKKACELWRRAGANKKNDWIGWDPFLLYFALSHFFPFMSSVE